MVVVTETGDKVWPAPVGATVRRGIEPERAIEPNAGLGGGGSSQSDCREQGGETRTHHPPHDAAAAMPSMASASDGARGRPAETPLEWMATLDDYAARSLSRYTR